MSLPSPSESNPTIHGPYAASRGAWLAAKAETQAAIEKMRAAIAKTRDSRAVQVNAALDRIVRRIPDAGSVLEALADVEEAGGDPTALRDQARKISQLASYYMRSDRLIAMVRENPFNPISVDKIFSRALQTMQRELK